MRATWPARVAARGQWQQVRAALQRVVQDG